MGGNRVSGSMGGMKGRKKGRKGYTQIWQGKPYAVGGDRSL